MNAKRILAFIIAFSLILALVMTGCQNSIDSVSSNNGGDINKVGTVGEKPSIQLGLYVEDGQLMLGGKEFTGIGASYFDAAFRYFSDPLSDDIDEGLRLLKEYGVTCIRVRFSPWQTEGMDLFKDDREKFYSILDRCVAACEKYELGIMCMLAFTTFAYRADETDHEFFSNRNGEGFKFMMEYITDIVNRYKYSPAIWGWEISSEYNLICNVLGTDLSPDTLGAFYEYVAAEIRRVDGGRRCINTGNSQNRNASYNLWRNGNWNTDSKEESFEVLSQYCVDNIDITSIHVYNPTQPWDRGTTDVDTYIRDHMEFCQGVKKPLYIGEYCDDQPIVTEEDSLSKFKRLHDAVVNNRVPLAMVWMYFTYVDRWLYPTEYQFYELQCIKEANEFYVSNGMQDTDSYWNAVNKVMMG